MKLLLFMCINKYVFSLVRSSVFTYKQNSLNKQWKVLLIAGWTIRVLLFKPTQVWHFVGIYLHTLWLLRALAKQINHRKAPQSANTSELQPRHMPAPVTNCLAVCTSGSHISHLLLHTGFTDPHRFGRVHDACLDSGQSNTKATLWYFFSIKRNSLLKSTGCFFFFFFTSTQQTKMSAGNSSRFLYTDCFERSHTFFHICALSPLARPKCHTVVHLDSIKLQGFLWGSTRNSDFFEIHRSTTDLLLTQPWKGIVIF